MNKPILTGQKVVLRPVTVDDADAMFASLSDEESRRLTGTHSDFTLEQVRDFCARVSAADDRADYAVTLPGDPAYRGEAVLNDIDLVNRSAGFRIALVGTENRNQGYGTEAAALLLEYAFNTLKLHRIALEVYDFNPRALHVYKKLGFKQEGLLRDALVWKGIYHDAVQMSLLESDYRADRTTLRFETLPTERLLIRRLRDADVPRLAAYRALPEVMALQLWDSYDVDKARDLVSSCRTTEPFTAGGWFQFAVALKTSDELVGDLYLNMTEDGRQAEIGYTFDPEQQGQGLATEAVRGLLNYAFTEQGLHRVYGVTDPRHHRSIALMQRVGMRREAHFRENLWFKGAWADDVLFAVLAREWRHF